MGLKMLIVSVCTYLERSGLQEMRDHVHPHIPGGRDESLWEHAAD